LKFEKTVLVTGGAGFIGSNFVEYFFDKYPKYCIIVLDKLTYAGSIENIREDILKNDRFSFWYGDITNESLVDNLVKKSSMVVHLAAETHVSRSIYDNHVFFMTDIMGTHSVANAVLKNKNIEKFVHISTSEVYGTAETRPMTEEHPLKPTTPYASAKAGADRLVYSYVITYDMPAVIIRPFNNYGPKQHLEKVIPNFITKALEDRELTIHGDGENYRDWLHVADHSKAIDLAIHADTDLVKGEVINLGTGMETSIKDIAQEILRSLGKESDLVKNIEDRPGQVKRHISSTEKAKKLLGWEAETPFNEGLKNTIDWYRKNTDWWKESQWLLELESKERKYL
jgi:dTDP-glucose 4,6-dehydratase